MGLGKAAWTLLHAALLSAGSVHASLAENATQEWLEWIRASGSEVCPDAAAFAAMIEKHLGRSPALAAGESRRRLVARIGREATDLSRWSAAVDVFDVAGNVVGRRTIAKVSESCESVADSLALVSALILSDLSPEESESPPVQAAVLAPGPSSEAASATATTTPVVTPGLPSHATAKPRGWSFAVEGGLAAAAGLLPGLDFGGEVSLRLAPTAWPLFYTTFVL